MPKSHFRNDDVERRWKLVATLVICSVAGWDLGLGLVLGWIQCSREITDELARNSPALAGWCVVLTIAVPMTLAVHRTLGSMPHANLSMSVAGSMVGVWALAQPGVFARNSWLQLPFDLAGAGIAFVGVRAMRGATPSTRRTTPKYLQREAVRHSWNLGS